MSANQPFYQKDPFSGLASSGDSPSLEELLSGASAFPKNEPPKYQEKWDARCFVTALILGALGLAAGMFIYGYTRLPNVLKIGLVVALTGGLAIFGATLFALLSNRHPQMQASMLGLALALTAILFGAGCLLQFIYGIGSGYVYSQIDDYLFVIDDSGSMADSDPNSMRISALRYLLDGIDRGKRAGLICFNDAVTNEVGLQELTDTHIERILGMGTMLMNSGNTDIYNALSHALSMEKADEEDRLLMIVLLTDGYSGTSMQLNALAKACREKNARISTIGLSAAVDEAMLNRIARMTNGMFYRIDDLDRLSDIYTNINWIDESRDLIGLRVGDKHVSMAYSVMRVAFWALLGAITGLGGMLILSHSPRPLLILIVSAVAGFLCGLMLEWYNRLWWDLLYLQGVSVFLLCIVVVFYRQVIKQDTRFDLSVYEMDNTAQDQSTLLENTLRDVPKTKTQNQLRWK